MKKVILLSSLLAYALPASCTNVQKVVEKAVATGQQLVQKVASSNKEIAAQKIKLEFAITYNGVEFASPTVAVVPNENFTIRVEDTEGNQYGISIVIKDFSENRIVCEYSLGQLNDSDTVPHNIVLNIGQGIELPAGYGIKLSSITPA